MVASGAAGCASMFPYEVEQILFVSQSHISDYFSLEKRS